VIDNPPREPHRPELSPLNSTSKRPLLADRLVIDGCAANDPRHVLADG
jgi:hypothetical protein